MAEGNFDGELDQLTQQAVEEEQAAARQKEEQREGENIDRWAKRVKMAKKHDEPYYKKWADFRQTAQGKSKYEVQANLTGAIMEVLAAFLYAKDPDLNVRPSASITRFRATDEEQRQRQVMYREFAKTLEIIISRMLKEANFKRTAKRWLRGAMTCGPGWIKAVMQTRMEQNQDPMVEKRINDLRDQLAKIQSKQAQLADSAEDPNKVISDLEANLTAAQGQVERMVAEGLVIDYMHPEDVVVAPECGEVENYLASPWLAFDSYKSKDETMRLVDWDDKTAIEYLEGANRYMQRPRKGEINESGEGYVKLDADEGNPESESQEGFFRIVEIWALCDGVVYTYVDGCNKRWARQPYAPLTGKRFYPNFLLAFHYGDAERYPQSDVEQLKSLQDEYNQVRSDFKTHRERARPGIVFNKFAVDADDVQALTRAQTQEFVGINLVKEDMDIRNALWPKTYNTVDPALYDTFPIHRDMERVSGAQEALQGTTSVAKTATEARIQDAGHGARSGARRDELDDVLTDLCQYIAQVSLQVLEQADAEKYAGPNAVWVNMTVDEAMTLFDIEIKAGSTGKPKAMSDRESWGTILPLLEGVIQKIGAARIAGQEWAAEPWIALLEETLTRLDDHADLESFLPKPPQVAPPADDGEAEKTKSEVQLNKAKTLGEIADTAAVVAELDLPAEVKNIFGMKLMEAAENGGSEEQPQAPIPEPQTQVQ